MPLELCATKVAVVASEFKTDPNPTKHRNLIMLALDYDTPWGYFDGAS